MQLFTELRTAAVDPAADYVRSVVAAVLCGDDPPNDPSGGDTSGAAA